MELLLTCRQKKGSVPRERLQEPDEQRLLGLVWRLRGTRMLFLALMPHHSRQGKAAPGCGATMIDIKLGKGAYSLEGTVLPRRSSALGGTSGASSGTSQQLCWFSVGVMH